MYPGPNSERTPYQPPYGVPPHRKKPPVLLFVLLGCGGCFLLSIPILAAILFPVFAQARLKARAASCLSNLKMQSLGLQMYLQDYDETFPVSKTWMDSIAPYTKAPGIYHCPEVSHRKDEPNNYGYAFNRKLSKKSLGDILDPRGTRMNYDSSNLTRNANDAETSVDLTRHGGSGNVSFVDGHARRLRSDGSDAAPSGIPPSQ